MSSRTRKADAKSRVVLPEDFAGRLVVVERVADDEVRVKLVPAVRKRPCLRELLAGMTEQNLPESIEFGPPVGKELL